MSMGETGWSDRGALKRCFNVCESRVARCQNLFHNLSSTIDFLEWLVATLRKCTEKAANSAHKFETTQVSTRYSPHKDTLFSSCSRVVYFKVTIMILQLFIPTPLFLFGAMLRMNKRASSIRSWRAATNRQVVLIPSLSDMHSDNLIIFFTLQTLALPCYFSSTATYPQRTMI